jgi:hypothetical protein
MSKRLLAYKVDLIEKKYNQWRLIIRYGKVTKSFEYLDFEYAMKEFRRAVEIRETTDPKKILEYVKRAERVRKEQAK